MTPHLVENKYFYLLFIYLILPENFLKYRLVTWEINICVLRHRPLLADINIILVSVSRINGLPPADGDVVLRCLWKSGASCHTLAKICFASVIIWGKSSPAQGKFMLWISVSVQILSCLHKKLLNISIVAQNKRHGSLNTLFDVLWQ